jgi:uncharacterized alpha-E superfamily protein
MLSRVANSIYWMNRYVERAENYARYVSVNFNLALDLPMSVAEQWDPLLIATTDNFTYYKYYDAPVREQVVAFMSFDERNPNSILTCVADARENARTIRESISREMWEYINQFYWRVKDAAVWSKTWDMSQYQTFFSQVKADVQLFYGIVDSTITRNEAWHFGRLGRLLERADKTTRFLDVSYFTYKPDSDAVGSTIELLLWTAVLKSVSAYNMYRQQYREISPSHIVEFLVLDKAFPRSVSYCIKQAELSLYEISGQAPTKGYSNLAEKALSKLRTDVEFTEISDITHLHEYLDTFQTRNNEAAGAIFKTYFDLKPIG